MLDRDLEHPEIGWIERTGYPSWMQQKDYEDEEDNWDDIFEDDICCDDEED